jgi:hypothetical protein
MPTGSCYFSHLANTIGLGIISQYLRLIHDIPAQVTPSVRGTFHPMLPPWKSGGTMGCCRRNKLIR